MKQTLRKIISTSAVSVLAFSAMAQDGSKATTDRPAYSQDRLQDRSESISDRAGDRNQNPTGQVGQQPGQQIGQQPGQQAGQQIGRQARQQVGHIQGAAKASDLVGMDVKNQQDVKLGTVKDLALDVESGRIVQVILASGGFVGIGEKLSAVPPGALHHDVNQDVLHLNVSQEQWDSAPAFEMSKWAESSNADQLSAVYGRYGQESALEFVENADSKLEGRRNDRQANRGDHSGIGGQREIAGQRNEAERSRLGSRTDAMEQAGSDSRQDAKDSSAIAASPSGEASRDKDQASSSIQSQSMIPASRLSQLQKATDLIGMAVENRQAEKLGDVNDILVDLPSGRILAVIISSGGFLGLGDELSAVPPAALSFTTTERDTLQLDVTKDTLSKAPHFKANQWPDFAEAGTAGSVYQAYKVQPYFSADATSRANNMRRNVRDRDADSLTAIDQGNSKTDVDTTAMIRKEINASENLSVGAKNVKIITKDGQVTLRGPVNSAEEKRIVGEIANRIARPSQVDNQLEVTLATTSSIH